MTNYKRSNAYIMGQRAYHSGKSIHQNPFRNSGFYARSDWTKGFLHEEKLTKELFDKYDKMLKKG